MSPGGLQRIPCPFLNVAVDPPRAGGEVSVVIGEGSIHVAQVAARRCTQEVRVGCQGVIWVQGEERRQGFGALGKQSGSDVRFTDPELPFALKLDVGRVRRLLKLVKGGVPITVAQSQRAGFQMDGR